MFDLLVKVEFCQEMFITSARNVVGAEPEFLIKNWITGILKNAN